MLEFDYDKGVSKAMAEKEDVPERAPSARKADIFDRRVLFPPATRTSTSPARRTRCSRR
jgi:N12 class adenine-specific DNA methylase